MKYLGVSLLTLLLALSAETTAQDNPFTRGGQRSDTVVKPEPIPVLECPDYKIGIVTPSKEVDFKIQTITPARNIDPGIVFNPCPGKSQLTLVPQFNLPNPGTQFLNGPSQELRESLKRQLIISGKNK